MSGVKSNSKKRASESAAAKPEMRKRTAAVDDDFDADISDDIKGIMSALKQIREKAHKDGQKKNEETISSVASGMKSKFNELKSKLEKERQSISKALMKSARECENALRDETAKFQALHDNYCKDKNAHLQALKEAVSKLEEEKERLFMRYEQLRKKEKNSISECEKACSSKMSELEESLKKKKQDDKTFSILRKSLGSFLENGSDEDFPVED